MGKLSEKRERGHGNPTSSFVLKGHREGDDATDQDRLTSQKDPWLDLFQKIIYKGEGKR